MELIKKTCFILFIGGTIIYGRVLDTLWTKKYEYMSQNIIRIAVETSDGGILVASESCDYPKSEPTGLVKIDAHFNEQWKCKIGDSLHGEYPRGIYEKSPGEFLVFTLRTDISGNSSSFIGSAAYNVFSGGLVPPNRLVSRRHFQTVKNRDTCLFALVRDSYSNGPWGIMEMNTNADSLRELRVNSSDSMEYTDLLTLKDGFIFCGTRVRLSDYTSRLFICRLDNNGQTIWQRIYGDNTYYFCDTKILVIDSGLFIRGTRINGISDTPDTRSVLLVKYDLNGTFIWDKFLYFGGTPKVNSLVELSEDKTLVFGGNIFYGAGSIRHFIAPYDYEGNAQGTTTFAFTTYSLPDIILLQLRDQRIVGITGKSNAAINQGEQVCAMEFQWNYPPYFVTTSLDMTSEALKDTLYADTVVAADSFQNDRVRYFFADSTPDGMNIDNSAGIIQWIPKAIKDSGNHVITVVAADRTGQSDTLRYTLHVTVRKVETISKVLPQHQKVEMFLSRKSLRLILPGNLTMDHSYTVVIADLKGRTRTYKIKGCSKQNYSINFGSELSARGIYVVSVSGPRTTIVRNRFVIE
jgi:hypothetical protein